MIYFLTISVILNVFFVYFCAKFGITIIKMQEAVEECLDKIDEKYNRLSQIVKMPVFYDSPEIKNIISEITSIQDDILEVAAILTNSLEKENKEKGE